MRRIFIDKIGQAFTYHIFMQGGLNMKYKNVAAYLKKFHNAKAVMEYTELVDGMTMVWVEFTVLLENLELVKYETTAIEIESALYGPNRNIIDDNERNFAVMKYQREHPYAMRNLVKNMEFEKIRDKVKMMSVYREFAERFENKEPDTAKEIKKKIEELEDALSKKLGH